MGETLPAIPGGFHSSPSSLRGVLAATRPPEPESWTMAKEEFIDADWTEECQGVTHGAGHWFFSSNGSHLASVVNRSPRAIYRFNGPELTGVYSLDVARGMHLGDLDFFEGHLFAPLEPSDDGALLGIPPIAGPEVLIVDADFTPSTPVTTSGVPLKGAAGGAPPQRDLPWCAVNPLNRLLYSSPFEQTDEVFAYDPQDGFRHTKTLRLRRPIDDVQGGCFSDVGHLYLASDAGRAIEAYSALNGQHLGSAGILVEEADQEVEGLCCVKLEVDGVASQLHVVLLENRDIAKDNIFFKHYQAPIPDAV